MRIAAVSKKWVSVVLSLAFAATAAGPKAHAADGAPCMRVSLPTWHANIPLPDLDGWWSPIHSTYRTPPHFEGVRFAGINGELLLGRIGFAITAESVSIVNGRGLARYLEIGEEAMLSEMPATAAPGAYLAYWERETLVVKTPEDQSDPRSVRVTERIFLKDRDTLEYAVRVVSPDEPTAPLEIRVLFRRESPQTWF